MLKLAISIASHHPVEPKDTPSFWHKKDRSQMIQLFVRRFPLSQVDNELWYDNAR
jgi:hypothetical protein